jgi:hypothetical protein
LGPAGPPGPQAVSPAGAVTGPVLSWHGQQREIWGGCEPDGTATRE